MHKLWAVMVLGLVACASDAETGVRINELVQAPVGRQAIGACVVRDSYTNVPMYSDSDGARGYAKANTDAYDVFGDLYAGNDWMQGKCSDDAMAVVMSAYCQQNSRPAQWQVAVYDLDGQWRLNGCVASGCDFHRCP